MSSYASEMGSATQHPATLRSGSRQRKIFLGVLDSRFLPSRHRIAHFQVRKSVLYRDRAQFLVANLNDFRRHFLFFLRGFTRYENNLADSQGTFKGSHDVLVRYRLWPQEIAR